ncbi:MAG: sialidase family protein [Candidatus Electryoneaceae bacterium]|nr:sialidase family protein [Candidatus Electryoneaceae bacterium]
MRKTTILLCLLCFFSANAVQQFNYDNSIPRRSGVTQFTYNVDTLWAPVRDRVGPNRQVSDIDGRRPQNETSVTINPDNRLHILGGCNDYRGDDASCGYYVSFDGGRTWEDGLIPGLDQFDAAGNPSVTIDNRGRTYFCGIHFNRDNDNGGIFVSRSDDGGRNWDDPIWVIVHPDEQRPPFEDKPYIGVDNTGGDYDGHLYVSWTRFGTGQIYFSRSTDAGRNWTDPLQLTDRRGQGSLPVVGIDGELYVIWKDYTDDRIIGRLSDDGGQSFGDIFVVAETDRIPRYIDPTGLRVNSIPSVAIDHSDGDHRNRIYVAWADDRSGDADILMVWSDDGGENWTEPLRLNDDEEENGLDQFLPWLAVDPVTGVLYAVWYDRRGDDDNLLMDLYGLRWDGFDDPPENEIVSSESIDPRIGGFDGRFIGDNNGIAALGGQAHPAWSDTRNNDQDIYWAPFEGDNHFALIDGDNEHFFTIEEFLINGEPPEEGDEITVTDYTRQAIGVVIIEGDPPYEFTASGDWQDRNKLNRNRVSYMYWQVWDASESEEFVGAPLVLEGDRWLTDDGETSMELYAPPPDQQEIELHRGWNIISTGIVPTSIDHRDFWDPVFDVALIIKCETGRFMAPQANGFSNLGPFASLEAFKVRVSEDVVLVVEGVQIDPQFPVPLDRGWNLVAYLPDYNLDPWEGFDSILDDLILAKNERGQFLAPSVPFSNMDDLQPGQGYMLKVDQDCELIYPPEE